MTKAAIVYAHLPSSCNFVEERPRIKEHCAVSTEDAARLADEFLRGGEEEPRFHKSPGLY
jgi:hypothetical protein